MQFSIGIEYALHCLLHMVDMPADRSLGIKDLAKYQGVPETYLSKIYTKLRKSGIVKSIPGVNGGYALARNPEDITFWDVVEAIEGTSSFFQCAEIRQKELLLDKKNLPDSYSKCPCLIKTVMTDAEEQMRQYLREKTLLWLSKSVSKKVSAENRNATKAWFTKN